MVKRAEDEIQKLTDSAIAQIEEHLTKKEADLNEGLVGRIYATCMDAVIAIHH